MEQLCHVASNFKGMKRLCEELYETPYNYADFEERKSGLEQSFSNSFSVTKLLRAMDPEHENSERVDSTTSIQP